VFRFAQTFDDMNAVLAFLRDTANVRAFGIDTTRLVIAGHSMGGMVAVRTAANDHRVRGAILISAGDMGARRKTPRDSVIKGMSENMESLAGVTAAQMADEMMTAGPAWAFERSVPGLAHVPLLVLTADDGLAPSADALVKKVRAAGNTRVTTLHVATDHSWSDRRIALEAAVIRWLDPIAQGR